MLFSQVNDFQPFLNHAWLKRLAELNIRHIEQIGSLLAAPEGRYALAKLKVPVDRVQKAVEPAIRNRLGLSLSNPFQGGESNRVPLLTRERHSMGYSAGDRDPFWEAAFDTALPDAPRPGSKPAAPDEPPSEPLPSSVILERAEDFRPRDQGRRGTCVAFTVVGMYYQMGIRARLSPAVLSAQYLYYRAKLEDPNPDTEGTSIDATLRVLSSRHGCCLDSNLEYNPRHDIGQDYRVRGHTPQHSEAELREMARHYRISGKREIEPNVEAVKTELALGRPVGVGLAVYQLAWYNTMARLRGEIALPLMDTSGPQAIILDSYLGGHAVTLVGYQDNSTEDKESDRPGGGYFLFRNSWGDEWAPGNEFRRGYGFLPYEYLTRFCLEAQVIDELALRKSKAATSDRQEAQAQSKARGNKARKESTPRGRRQRRS